MKRKVCLVIVSLLIVGAVVSTSLAASVQGRCWTGSPSRILGIAYGYYCTAAQNQSSNGTNRKAYAKSMKNGSIIAEANTTGNNSAVANSGFNKPTSGYGEYSETGGEGHAYFNSGAYSDY